MAFPGSTDTTNWGVQGPTAEQMQMQLELEKQKQAAEAQRVATLAAQGMNADGSPIRKAFDSITDSAGNLNKNYQMDLKGLDPTQWEGYSKQKQEALRIGPSTWASLAGKQQDLTTLGNKEAAARQAQSGMNQGLSSLAMRGGLSSGARGLAARQSSRDMLNSRQQAARAGDTAKLGIATTDEQNRIGQLAGLSNSEQQIGQYNNTLAGKQQEFNIQNMIGQQQEKRAYDTNTYNEQMKKWSADKQAQATAASGGGGGKK
jgi:hypothetical protein